MLTPGTVKTCSIPESDEIPPTSSLGIFWIGETLMPQHRYATCRILILLAGLLLSFSLFAAGISTTEKYAWTENAGWLNFAATNGNVQVYADHLEGYVWAENIGWIRLGSFSGGSAHTYSNTSNTDYGVNRAGTNLSGYAWSENVGWINFNSANGGPVTLNVTGQFDGYAWSENVGWIHLRSATPTAYGVALEPAYALTITSAGTGSGTISGGGSYAGGAAVTLTAIPTTGSTFAGWSGPSPCAANFTMPANALTCTATFTLNSYAVTPSVIGTNGSISPNTVQTVPYAGTTTFTVTANAGYTASVTGCGGSLTGNLYITGPITSNCTVSASFILNAAALVVTKLADTNDGVCDADCSLREAVVAANAGAADPDIITFQTGLTGIITLSLGEITISDDVTIQGPGASTLAVSGNNVSRIFTVAPSKTVVIDGLTLQHGSSANPGGAILNDGGILTVSNSALTGNQSTWALGGSFRGGGAIANSANGAIKGTLTVTDSTLSSNIAVIGGAINNEDGCTATVRNSALTSNSATAASITGGAGIFSQGTLTVDSSTLSSNTAAYKGGGLLTWAGTATNTTVINSTVSLNTAKSGGGLSNEGAASTVDLRNSTLSSNTSNGGATHGGGGMLNYLGIVKMTNSTVSGNLSTNTGGGIENYGSVTLTNSTMTGNSATVNGGGIYTESVVTTGNSLIAGNTPNEMRISSSGPGTLTSQGYNLFGVSNVPGISGTYTAGTGDFTPTVALTSIIGGLANNGGPTTTHLLVASSPALNAGSNGLIPSGVSNDQRGTGFPRIQPVAGTVDIGAVEVSSVPTHTVTPSAGANGSISPNTPQPVASGSTTTFTVTPATDYTAIMSGTCGGNLVGSTYTTNAITANCTVIASFSALPTLSINSVSQTEGNTGSTPFVFTVTLSTAATQPVTVNWATADGTATAGSDYTAATGSLIFAPGVLTQAITVQVTGDTLVEPDETFFVNLSTPVHATIAQAQGTGTILNDDALADFGIAWSGSEFVAVGSLGGLHTSGDGASWIARTSGTSEALNSVAWSGQQFVVVGSGGTILTSPNGASWTAPTSGATAALNGVAWSGSQFVAVGNAGTVLTSPDGLNWTAQNTGTLLFAVTWAGSQWVAVGAGGAILTSTTGTAWSSATVGTRDLLGIAWSGEQLVAVGSNGTILTSPNGATWIVRPSSTTQDLSGIAWSGSQFLAVGTGGVLLASPDGIAWASQASGATEDLYGIAWSGDRWIAVGTGNTRITLTRPWGDLKLLLPNRWTMLGLPGVPGNTTVANAFTGLDPATYGDWLVYDYDRVAKQYRELPPTARLSQNTGYWLLDESSSSSHPIQLSVPATATQVVFSAGCPSTSGCYAIPLTAPSSPDTSLFNLVGMPFPYPVGWWEVRLDVDGTAYPLDAASVYVEKNYWVWNGNDYDSYDSHTLGSIGILQPWQSLWIKVLAASRGHTLKLLIPRIPKTSQAPTSIPGWLRALDWLIPPAVAAEADHPAIRASQPSP
jgi:CSLREA domain-containing protein